NRKSVSRIIGAISTTAGVTIWWPSRLPDHTDSSTDMPLSGHVCFETSRIRMKTFAVSRIVGMLLLGTAGACWAGEPDSQLLERGKTLFSTEAVPACAICHTLQDADATGAIGPDLDELKPDAERI